MTPTRKLPTEKHSVQSHCKDQQLSQAMHRCNGTTIKQEIYNHRFFFANRSYSTNSSLSTHIWRLKRHEHLTHHYLENAKTSIHLQQDIKKCFLCFHKKLAIITHPSEKKTKNQKFNPNADMRTNIYSHFSIHSHNPFILTIPIPLLKIPLK